MRVALPKLLTRGLALFLLVPYLRTQQPEEHIAFEVASIRPSKPDASQGATWGIKPDGYSTRGQDLWVTVMIAFYPNEPYLHPAGSITDYPKASWARTQYDIDAKVAAQDVDRWGQQDRRHLLLSSALQDMLKERCHLAAHRAQREQASFALTLGKRLPLYQKFIPNQPDPPNSIRMLGGRMIPGDTQVRFFGISMETLASYLTDSASRPVVDRTGQQGLYNITLIPYPREHHDPSEPDPPSYFDLEASGFTLKPIKIMADTLVIDHLEPPTPN